MKSREEETVEFEFKAIKLIVIRIKTCHSLKKIFWVNWKTWISCRVTWSSFDGRQVWQQKHRLENLEWLPVKAVGSGSGPPLTTRCCGRILRAAQRNAPCRTAPRMVAGGGACAPPAGTQDAQPIAQSDTPGNAARPCARPQRRRATWSRARWREASESKMRIFAHFFPTWHFCWAAEEAAEPPAECLRPRSFPGGGERITRAAAAAAPGAARQVTRSASARLGSIYQEHGRRFSLRAQRSARGTWRRNQ